MLTVSLEELRRYAAATPTTRNMREGQQVINSDLLIVYGVTAKTSVNIVICFMFTDKRYNIRSAKA